MHRHNTSKWKNIFINFTTHKNINLTTYAQTSETRITPTSWLYASANHSSYRLHPCLQNVTTQHVLIPSIQHKQMKEHLHQLDDTIFNALSKWCTFCQIDVFRVSSSWWRCVLICTCCVHLHVNSHCLCIIATLVWGNFVWCQPVTQSFLIILWHFWDTPIC